MRRFVVVMAAAVLVAVMGFLVWEEGLPAYHRAQGVPAVTPGERLGVPAQVFAPPAFVPSTADWGPPGPVALVFRGREARVGFSGRVADPWYAVSARDGGYWRLDAPRLDQVRGQLRLSPDGTRLAWWWPGGIAEYDTMTGRSAEYPLAVGPEEAPLAWSPDATQIAFGSDPVRVLDTRSGEVVSLPLRAPGAGTPAWTPDGRWVSLASGQAVAAARPASGQVHRWSARVDGIRSPAWNGGGDLAGLHPTAHHNVLRVVRGAAPGTVEPAGGAGARAQVVDASPSGLVIEGFLGWSSGSQVVLTGLQPETGAIEQAMRLSLPDNALQPYMLFPALGGNWAGVRTVSLATDLLSRPTRAFDKPTLVWSPTAKLRLCLLLALFPTAYLMIARRRKA